MNTEYLILTTICIYIAGVIGLWAYDAFVGIDEPEIQKAEMDRGQNNTTVYFLWVLVVPLLLFLGTLDSFTSVKKKRIEAALAAKKIRIAKEAEDQKLLEEVEKELENSNSYRP